MLNIPWIEDKKTPPGLFLCLLGCFGYKLAMVPRWERHIFLALIWQIEDHVFPGPQA